MSENPSVTKNEVSGESDPGYESDGTKKLLRLQKDISETPIAQAEKHLHTSSSSSHKSIDSKGSAKTEDHTEPKLSSKYDGQKTLNIVNVGNESSDASFDELHITANKSSFSSPNMIRHKISIAHSANIKKNEAYDNVTSQGKKPRHSPSRNWNNLCNPFSGDGTFPKSSNLPQKYHVNGENDNIRNISIPSTMNTHSQKSLSIMEPSYSNVLVIPIDSSGNESFSSKNDEDLEVSSIFDDLIQNVDQEQNYHANDIMINSQYKEYNLPDGKTTHHATRFSLDENPGKSKSSMELPNITMKIFSPVVLEDDNLSTPKALHSALSRVDVAKLGTSYDLVLGLVKKNNSSTPDENFKKFKTLERPGKMTNCDTFRSSQLEDKFYDAKKKCLGLKRTLSRVKNEIEDRKGFLGIIKEIASAIKKLLDSVNIVIQHVSNDERGLDLEDKKKEFVKGSKRFSNTLKEYFRDGNSIMVINESEFLIVQVNEIMLALIVVL